MGFDRKHSNRQAHAAILFFEEYPALANYVSLDDFINGLIEPSNAFFSTMLQEGRGFFEAQELTTKLYVIEPLYHIVESNNLEMETDEE